MARKQHRSRTAISPKMADDFELIRGIGPALAAKLHHAGIHSYRDLASLTPKKLAASIAGVSIGQIAKRNWISQARKLVAEKTQRKPHKKRKAAPGIRQHYENFTIEFLLDEKNVARRTHVVHVQGGDADTWAGWKPQLLIDFLSRHTRIHNETGETSLTVKKPFEPVLPSPMESELAVSVTEKAKSISPSAIAHDLTGTLRLRDLKVVSIDTTVPIFSLRHGQPYMLRLTLDLTEVVAPSDLPLKCEATILVKQLGGSRQMMGEVSNTLKPGDSATLEIVGTSLPPALYRLDAFVKLISDQSKPGLAAFRKGELLQVY